MLFYFLSSSVAPAIHDTFGHLLQDASYPTVALYPAQNKHAPIIFEGAAEVCSLHQFISRYGRASAKLRSKFSGFLLQMTSCLGVTPD
jgi:hypothetical protein